MNAQSPVALFWAPDRKFDTWGTNTVIYSGQKRTDKMDHLFDQAVNTPFYMFKKNNKRGWEFVGKARANRRTRDRILDRQQDVYAPSGRAPPKEAYQAPQWEMTFEPSCHFSDTITQVIAIYHQNAPDDRTYLTKDVLLHTLLGARPLCPLRGRPLIAPEGQCGSKAVLGTGIVPFTKEC